MAHEFESGFFVNQPAWHGLGTVLNAPPTIADALKLAGLDWDVALEQLSLPDGTNVDRWGVVRSSDRRVLGTVGPGFRTVQNGAAFDWFQPFVDAGLVDLEAAGALREGSRIWILAKVRGDATVIVPQSDDKVEKYLLLAHGHDGSLAIRLGLTPVRVVCQNTLSASLRGNSGMLKIRHTVGAADALKAAQETIERANNDFSKAAEIYKALSGVYVRAGELRRYVDAVFPPPKAKAGKAERPEHTGIDAVSFMADLRAANANSALVDGLLTSGAERAAGDDDRRRIFDEIETLFEGGRGNDLAGVRGTAWGAYNAVTEYMTHERGHNADNRANSNWFGPDGARAIQAAQSTFLGA